MDTEKCQLGRVVSLCDPESADHDWKPSGMYMMRYTEVHDGWGNFLGEKLTGGRFYGGTPEVQICQRCGLLRIKLEKSA